MNQGDQRQGIEIQRKEFDELMKQFNGKAFKAKGTAEVVYRIPTAPAKELSIWVYSTIAHKTGVSRRLGSDAIRIMMLYQGKNVVIKESKTLRKGNWKENVKRKIRSLMDRTTEHQCPQGHPLVQRERKKDGKRFYGCVMFPQCKYTQLILPGS
ncbi:MAG: hypothetical protein ACFFB3_23950 [Candidatus Hodarchaeota archaeon]